MGRTSFIRNGNGFVLSQGLVFQWIMGRSRRDCCGLKDSRGAHSALKAIRLTDRLIAARIRWPGGGGCIVELLRDSWIVQIRRSLRGPVHLCTILLLSVHLWTGPLSLRRSLMLRKWSTRTYWCLASDMRLSKTFHEGRQTNPIETSKSSTMLSKPVGTNALAFNKVKSTENFAMN